ncbi:nucleotidyltransferase substrate binding protein [Megasphaera sp.]|uniref:nucleotidyltransferase substrate binding protein n=1 Tax=Megasphaera sp. TaxID=2023260 RepID=UPI0025C25AF9|nr:nucleotidyltransferase substrate binding protein [Megasphaera sp.]MCF0152830.1 nucleotidyltransferase substrate binding protein [Megasphaera sp.]
MDWQHDFQEHIQLLQQAGEADLTNPYVCHGIVHIFQEAFDLGLMAFRDALKRDGQGMAAMGSSKELIAAAYEQYLFVDEDIWLAMLRDRHGSQDAIEAQVERILGDYQASLAALYDSDVAVPQ